MTAHSLLFKWILLSCLSVALAGGAFAQSGNPQWWLQAYLQHKAQNGLYLEADAGYRGLSVGTRPTLALARFGLGKHFGAGYCSAGLAWFETIETDPAILNRAELRVSEKLFLRQAIKVLDLTHTFRIEERWLQRADHSGYDFRMRFRYQLQGIKAFKSCKLLGAMPYVTANSEIMLAADARVFSQLRLYGGAGLDWNKTWKLECGFLHQWLAAIPMGTWPHEIIRTSVTYSW